MDDCKHTDLIYCPNCNIVSCRDCGKKWIEPTSYDFKYVNSDDTFKFYNFDPSLFQSEI